MSSINERPRKRRVMRHHHRTNRRIISIQCIIIIGIILWSVATIVGWKVVGPTTHSTQESLPFLSRQHNHLRGRQKNGNAIWVHSDSQPFVSVDATIYVYAISLFLTMNIYKYNPPTFLFICVIMHNTCI